MNILVTGGNGQLGNEMRVVSKESRNRYIFTDVVELDITNLEAIRYMLKMERVDVVVNCAAYTNVDRAEEDEIMADLLNNKAAGNLAVVAKEVGATLIHVSTDYVFQGDKNTPYKEDCETSPLGVYGRTKLAGERSIQATGCNYLIFRTSWLYSSYGKNFVKTMQRLTRDKNSLKVVFDQVGTPTYAGDLAVAMLTVLERAEAGKFIPGIYHFSDEGVCSWYDFTVKILQIAGMNNRVIPIETKDYPTPASRPHYSVLNKGKIKSSYGLTIPHWETSLAYCMNNKV